MRPWKLLYDGNISVKKSYFAPKKLDEFKRPLKIDFKGLFVF